MLSLIMKQPLVSGNTANFDLEKPNFCQLLNLYFTFLLGKYKMTTLVVKYLQFNLFIGCSFCKNYNLVKVSQNFGGF